MQTKTRSAGGQVPEDWKERPAKAKPSVDGANRIDLAIPAFGYKNQISSDRRHGLIRNWTVSSAAAHDGARLEAALDRRNLASAVWADRYPAQ